MRTTIHLPENFRDKVDYIKAVTGKSFSSIVREALEEYYERLKRKEMIRELEEDVCGKALLVSEEEILEEIEEMRRGSDRF